MKEKKPWTKPTEMPEAISSFPTDPQQATVRLQEFQNRVVEQKGFLLALQSERQEVENELELAEGELEYTDPGDSRRNSLLLRAGELKTKLKNLDINEKAKRHEMALTEGEIDKINTFLFTGKMPEKTWRK